MVTIKTFERGRVEYYKAESLRAAIRLAEAFVAAGFSWGEKCRVFEAGTVEIWDGMKIVEPGERP